MIHRKIFEVQRAVEKREDFRTVSDDDFFELVRSTLLQHGLYFYYADSQAEYVGDRYYAIATIVVVDMETGREVSVKGRSKGTGMRTLQRARKFAFENLFLINGGGRVSKEATPFSPLVDTPEKSDETSFYQSEPPSLEELEVLLARKRNVVNAVSFTVLEEEDFGTPRPHPKEDVLEQNSDLKWYQGIDSFGRVVVHDTYWGVSENVLDFLDGDDDAKIEKGKSLNQARMKHDKTPERDLLPFGKRRSDEHTVLAKSLSRVFNGLDTKVFSDDELQLLAEETYTFARRPVGDDFVAYIFDVLRKIKVSEPKRVASLVIQLMISEAELRGVELNHPIISTLRKAVKDVTP